MLSKILVSNNTDETLEIASKLGQQLKGGEVIELISDNDKSAVKQIEDIIDTILVYIVHIESFNQLINNIPISTIIKRKNKLLNTIIDIPNEKSLDQLILFLQELKEEHYKK